MDRYHFNNDDRAWRAEVENMRAQVMTSLILQVKGKAWIGVEAHWELTTGSAAGVASSALAFTAKDPSWRKKSWEMGCIWRSRVKAPLQKGLRSHAEDFKLGYMWRQQNQLAVQRENGGKGELSTQGRVMGAKEPSGSIKQVERGPSHMPVHNCTQPVHHSSTKDGCRQMNTANECQLPAVLLHIQREKLSFKASKWVSWKVHVVLCLCNIFKFALRYLDTGSFKMPIFAAK